MALLAGANRLHAQALVELRGRIIDSISGEPVRDAIVRAPVVQRYTLTNADGAFRIADVPRGRVSLHIIHVAYGEQVVRADVAPDEFIVIGIAPRTIRLDSIVVEDTRRTDEVMKDAASWRAWHLRQRPFQ